MASSTAYIAVNSFETSPLRKSDALGKALLLSLASLFIDTYRHNSGAALREHGSQCPADPAGAAGYDDYLSL